MATVHVAVAVILDPDCRVLVTRRPQHVHQGGLWEFPGGKVEAGEDVLAALERELYEELGIVVERSEPLLEVRHDYGDKAVWLDVHVVRAFSGQARGMEGQPLRWAPARELTSLPFPAANAPILRAVMEMLD